jgi:hypothetical protein
MGGGRVVPPGLRLGVIPRGLLKTAARREPSRCVRPDWPTLSGGATRPPVPRSWGGSRANRLILLGGRRARVAHCGAPRGENQVLCVSTNRAPVAQWIEHLTSDQKVECSNHSGRATFTRGFEAPRCTTRHRGATRLLHTLLQTLPARPRPIRLHGSPGIGQRRSPGQTRSRAHVRAWEASSVLA